VAGADPAATDAFDNAWDIRALLAGSIEAYFFHGGEPGYAIGDDKLWHDFRAAELPKEWALEVLAENGREVTMTWTLPTGDVDCGGNQFILTDLDGVIPDTDLCGVSSINYLGDGILRRFVLEVN